MQILQSRINHGVIVLDGKEVGYTLQCVHCGSHEQIIPGSGKKRAFCPQCNMGFVCGQSACMVHIPTAAKLDYIEAKQREDSKAYIAELEKKYPLIGRISL